MAQRKGITSGTTAQRSIEEVGKLRFNTTTGLLEFYNGTNWKGLDAPPTVSSVSPTNATSGDGTGNYTFVITGTSFTGGSADLINASGTSVSFDTVTVNSDTQITAVVAKSSVPGSGEPYDVRVTAASGLRATLENQINIDQQPVFQTAAGSLTTVANGARATFSAITIPAHDPESGGEVTFTLESGSLPAGLSGSSTNSGYVISGTPDAVGSNTTSNFTIRAKDNNSNTSDRAFSITVNAPAQQSFTSSGTFSVPSGVSAVDVLVVAGGGSGGLQHGGAGGAGGLIYRPGFTVTPGGTVSVTVGEGGPGGTGGAPVILNGQDSVFGTLTAKGGGHGTVAGDNGGPKNSTSGGSGGGGGYQANTSGSSATQPNQSGESGNYGFGNPGGNANTAGDDAGGGGGGAGAAGQPGPSTYAGTGGAGGIGKAYTIADGTTSVYYAGGGGGGAHSGSQPYRGVGGQGGGGQGGVYAPGSGARATAGTANRGGGGGGEGASISQYATQNMAGGKGIVIVSY